MCDFLTETSTHPHTHAHKQFYLNVSRIVESFYCCILPWENQLNREQVKKSGQTLAGNVEFAYAPQWLLTHTEVVCELQFEMNGDALNRLATVSICVSTCTCDACLRNLLFSCVENCFALDSWVISFRSQLLNLLSLHRHCDRLRNFNGCFERERERGKGETRCRYQKYVIFPFIWESMRFI